MVLSFCVMREASMFSGLQNGQTPEGIQFPRYRSLHSASVHGADSVLILTLAL